MFFSTQRKSLSLACMLPFVTLLSAAPALATGTYTTTLNVSLTLNSSCTILLNGPLSFGAQTPASIATGVSGVSTSMSVNCPISTSYTISMGSGLSFNAGSRQLIGPGSAPNTINYKICQDALCSTPWGDGTSATGGAIISTQMGTGNTQNITIYGQIPPQVVTAYALGSYVDQVTVTINY